PSLEPSAAATRGAVLAVGRSRTHPTAGAESVMASVMKSAASRTERTRLRRLEPIVRRAMRGPCRLPRGSTLLVAVSGGADSTALLVALASLAREFDLAIHAAHLHHGLRGPDADADLAHVRS